jgi:hypothetical protein
MQKAVANMALIQQLFQASTMTASETADDATLITLLEQNDKTFISIAYEASAMERALLDFNANDFALLHWQAFLKHAPEHSTQIHIGLGWAIAKRRIALEHVEAAIESHQIPRVLDGTGYCEGTFKQRIAVKDMKTPEWLNDNLRRGYDQGLGRSLWYTAKAEPETLTNLIAPFAEERKQDLWRGVGIALAYVGGCDEETLQQLKTLSGAYVSDLAVGVTLATLSRKTANTINVDMELTCRVICNADVASVCADAENKTTGDYFEWVEHIKNI